MPPAQARAARRSRSAQVAALRRRASSTLVGLSAADFERAEAEESYSEGIIDQLRALQGTKVAALVRELSSGERKGQHKVSLRATDDDVDVSIIARAQGGGGHRRAAGFSTTLELEELIAFLRAAIAAQLHAVLRRARGRHGSPECRAPPRERSAASNGRGAADRQARRASARTTWWPRCGARSAGPRRATPARSTRSPRACCSCSSAGPRKSQSALMALPKRYETVARLGAASSTGDTEGEITDDRAACRRDPPPLPTGELRQRPPMHSAVKIGGERAYKRARRGESFEMPERIVTVHRFEQLWRERARRAGARRPPSRSNAARAPTCAR